MPMQWETFYKAQALSPIHSLMFVGLDREIRVRIPSTCHAASKHCQFGLHHVAMPILAIHSSIGKCLAAIF